MKILLTILKAPLTWRVMILMVVLLMLRELKSIHRKVANMNPKEEHQHMSWNDSCHPACTCITHKP